MTKFEDVLQTAHKSQDSQTDKKSLPNDNSVAEVSFANLTIRVQRNQRLHWLIEAKKQGTSLTAAIIEALNARFGSPDLL